MKQRISVDQLLKFNDKQRVRLLDYYKPQIGDIVLELNLDINSNFNVVKIVDSDMFIKTQCSRYDKLYKNTEYNIIFLPLLTIGQCLELIEKENYYLITENIKGNNVYHILKYDAIKDRHIGIIIHYSELINALVDALMIIL